MLAFMLLHEKVFRGFKHKRCSAVAFNSFIKFVRIKFDDSATYETKHVIETQQNIFHSSQAQHYSLSILNTLGVQ